MELDNTYWEEIVDEEALKVEHEIESEEEK